MRISGATLTIIRLSALMVGLVAILTLAVVTVRFQRSGRILAAADGMQTMLAERDRRLAQSRANLDEMNQVAARLVAELGNVGAMVREVQAYAGLDPDASVTAELSSGQVPEGLAFGGPGTGAMPARSVDLIRSDLDALVAAVRADLATLSSDLVDVRDTVAYREAQVTSSPTLWPVGGWISSWYGWRPSPINGRTSLHKGVDIVAPYRTPIAATAAGRVVTAGWSPSGYGNHLVINHGYGYTTLYAHLSQIDVEEGQVVRQGDTLGLVGSTGFSTGPHLHYEVWENGLAVDPIPFLKD